MYLFIGIGYSFFILKTHLKYAVLRKLFQEWFLRTDKAGKPSHLVTASFIIKNGRF